jgi:hypothetical protein
MRQEREERRQKGEQREQKLSSAVLQLETQVQRLIEKSSDAQTKI